MFKEENKKPSQRLRVVTTDTTLKVKADKKRVNISINPFLWDELSNITKNKSKLIEEYIKGLIEEEKGKKIIDIPNTRKW